MLRKILGLAVVAVALFGCAATPVAPPPQSRIAVVSVLGNQLQLLQIGVTVFGNAQGSVDVSAWNVDSHVETMLVDILSGAGYRPKIAPSSSRMALGRIQFSKLTARSSFEGGPSAAKAVAAEAGADLLLVATDTPQVAGITSYGVYQRRGRGAAVDTAVVTLLLVDGKTGEILSAGQAYASVNRDDSVWIDMEKTAPSIEALGEPASAFLDVIYTATKRAAANLKLISVS